MILNFSYIILNIKMSERVIEKLKSDEYLYNESIFEILANYYIIVSNEEDYDEDYLTKKLNNECKILADIINLFTRGYVDYIKNYFDDEDYYECKLQSFREYINDFIHNTEQGIYDELDAFMEEYVDE